jgi:hypothetical protein
MSGPTPTPDLLERHQAAMAIIRQIDPAERVLLLAAVVDPSEEWLVELERERRRREHTVAV